MKKNKKVEDKKISKINSIHSKNTVDAEIFDLNQSLEQLNKQSNDSEVLNSSEKNKENQKNNLEQNKLSDKRKPRSQNNFMGGRGIPKRKKVKFDKFRIK